MIVAIVVDSNVAFSPEGAPSVSLLRMPIGPETVLRHLARLAVEVGCEQLVILSEMDLQGDGSSLRLDSLGCDAKVARPAELGSVLAGLEPSDRLLFVDPRYMPSGGFAFAAVLGDGGFPGATHLVVLDAGGDGLVERVHCDEKGEVRCIRRTYHQVTHVEANLGMIPCSSVPVSAVQERSFSSLAELRASMTMRGVMNRDVPLTTELFDLTTEPGLLAANELMLTAAAQGNLPPGYSRLAPGVLLGRGGLIDETVDIVPPVLIQPGVLLEEDVKVIGPALIGEGSTIQRGAVIAQALTAPGTVIDAGAVVRHCVAFSSNVDGVKRSERAATGSQRFESALARPLRGGLAASPMRDGAKSRVLFKVLKKAFDLTAATVGLLVLLPLLLLVALLVKLTSRGPIFFVHHREGKDGKPFPCLKFRTMRQDAHRMQRKLYEQSEVDGPQFKMEQDPRITPIGRFLRSSNLDELPQLINVFVGHMSLVGPRPSPFRENQICVPWRRARLSVRPGITGLWQICRSDRDAGDFQQWIFYDTMYVRNMSLWLDMKILLATILTAGGKRNVPLRLLVPRDGFQSKLRH